MQSMTNIYFHQTHLFVTRRRDLWPKQPRKSALWKNPIFGQLFRTQNSQILLKPLLITAIHILQVVLIIQTLHAIWPT